MNDIEKLLKRRKELLEKISGAPLWVSGSVVETIRKAKGKETPFFYLSQSINGKNKITYISAAKLNEFKKATAEGTKIKKLQFELSTTNMKLIKAGYIND